MHLMQKFKFLVSTIRVKLLEMHMRGNYTNSSFLCNQHSAANHGGRSQNTVPIASTQVAVKGIVQYSTRADTRPVGQSDSW